MKHYHRILNRRIMAAELHSETSQKSESRLKFVNYFRGKNSTLDV